MAKPLWSGDASRKILARVVVEGDLVLETPAHFGNGDTDELTDMPLLVDPLDNKTPLLTGASIAGALRSYLREREHGYRECATKNSASARLFGSLRGDDEGEQSLLIVDDSLGQNFGIEIRDGVRIHPESRTAEEDKLFGVQLWHGGTTFPLRFELLIRDVDDADSLKQALATALAGFNDGGITLGARKRRGYGRVSVPEWRIRSYALDNRDDLLVWLEHGDEPIDGLPPVMDIGVPLSVKQSVYDCRHSFHFSATFSIAGSLLIRSGGEQDDIGPDMVHLHSRQLNGDKKPILPGTSLAGALRARALKISTTLGSRGKARELIGEIFGVEMAENVQPQASRITVQEHVVGIPVDPDSIDRTRLVQNRVSIDRFTGGARETALFSEQPTFGGKDTEVMIDVRLVNPKDYEVGLLLLLLKDLWTSDLPLGGEISVGRGRLQGKEAEMTYEKGQKRESWQIKGQGLTRGFENNRGPQCIGGLC